MFKRGTGIAFQIALFSPNIFKIQEIFQIHSPLSLLPAKEKKRKGKKKDQHTQVYKP